METAYTWLMNNGYEDIAKVIDEIITEWKLNGKKTRRNWWEKLSGDKKGNPKRVGEREIPILRAAQIRQGVTISKNAICRNENERIPEIRKNNRWVKNKSE